MLYKGYTLKKHIVTVNGIAHSGIGIFKEERFLSIASDMELAKRAVDAREKIPRKEQ